jgi:hypothetical protein
MFREYMVNGGELSPEVQAVMKAAHDVANGTFDVTQAALFYQIRSGKIVDFIHESNEYDMIFTRTREDK